MAVEPLLSQCGLPAGGPPAQLAMAEDDVSVRGVLVDEDGYGYGVSLQEFVTRIADKIFGSPVFRAALLSVLLIAALMPLTLVNDGITGSATALSAQALGASNSTLVPLSEKDGGELCHGDLGDVRHQLPFYAQFVASMVMVLCLHLGFPTKNLQAEVRTKDVVASVVLTLAAAKKAYEDIASGLVFFLQAWGYCVGTLVVARVVLLPGCPIRMLLERSFKPKNLTLPGEDPLQRLLNHIFLPVCNMFAQMITVMIACGVIGFGSFVTFCLCNLLLHHYATGASADYNCSSLRWSMAASQCPNFVQAWVMLSAFKDITFHRKLINFPFLVTSVLYAPPLAMVLVTHVAPGTIVYAFPLTLMLILGVFTMYKLLVHYGVLDPTEYSDSHWYDPATHSIRIDLGFKLLVLPFILHCQFAGEAMVRLYRGHGWWLSLYRTWAERRLHSYLTYVLANAWIAFNQLWRFL
eukprot:TRINITY_DN8475_c0_g2_i1.p1 TRINITY_DN8475_c0_g2~~TRINITY_DN8475_c0_g2_i1.p1  ORF type:complete len:490 (+),score=43.01 TRINITY_DN8475_c0_g2_i1:77-1471(+)